VRIALIGPAVPDQGGAARHTTELAYRLPPVLADASQLRQAILNLVNNASEALGEQGGDIVVRTGARRCDREYLRRTYLDDGLPEGEYVFVEVADAGEVLRNWDQIKAAEPGRKRAPPRQQLPGGHPGQIALVLFHYTRVCSCQARQSTTLEIARQRVEFGQPLGRQPVRQRLLAPVGPCLRQRDLPAEPARADEHRVRPAALGIQDLQPLPVQRVERISDNHETRRVTGQRGTMPLQRHGHRGLRVG